MKKRLAILKKDVVVNVVVIEDGADWEPPKGHEAIESDTASVGWLYQNSQFKDPVEKERPVPLTYTENRAAEYPPIGDQLDALMKWIATENEFTVPDELKSIAMKCMSVKAKYPKPEASE